MSDDDEAGTRRGMIGFIVVLVIIGAVCVVLRFGFGWSW